MSPPRLAARPSKMAIVKGQPDAECRAAAFRVLSMLTEPLRASMFRFTTSMPTPRPETSVTCSAVEKPGRK